ncbi:MAG TPA: DegT/DnrJ/EryC1/StrS family aminotransferase [Xanthobacteraceae bacterium]|jgi:perosamine synthetase|nr:DegT/DnrJ/EryC1/StrS family aminotransferase [Xanthobacteraceae bacterium]
MIPVFDPDIGEEEIAAVVSALRRKEISGSFGRSIPEFEERFAAYCGCKYGVAVTSGTTALHLAVAALDLPEGSEILMSASTNIASGLAAYHNGSIPVGVDSEETTWNLNLDLIEDLITPATRAIMPVHLFGHPVDMDALGRLALKHDLYVIEDCAEAHGASCRGQIVGSFGDMGCFSFYANKLVTTGEGGMIVTNDMCLVERLRLLRNLGFTNPRFRHEVAGYNFRLTAFQAAMGVVQVEKLSLVIEAKRRMAKKYGEVLGEIPGLRLPVEAAWARHVYWMYGVVVDSEFGVSRDELAGELSRRGIETRTFFCPMNAQPCFGSMDGFRAVPTPVADMLWQRGFYLPSSHTLTGGQIEGIGSAIAEIQQGSCV